MIFRGERRWKRREKLENENGKAKGKEEDLTHRYTSDERLELGISDKPGTRTGPR